MEMAEEEDFFAVPALQHHGGAGKGPLPQGGKGQLPPQHPCWTSSQLLLLAAGSSSMRTRRKQAHGNRVAR